MTRYWGTALLAALWLALLAASSEAHDAVDRKSSLKPSDDPTKAAAVIIGVITTTTLLVLILLISTLVYYKLKESREDEMITIKM